LNAQGFNLARACVKAPLVASRILKSLPETVLKKLSSSRCMELLKTMMMTIKFFKESFLFRENTPERPSFERLLNSSFSSSCDIFLDNFSR
jgi:hypothetical protein